MKRYILSLWLLVLCALPASAQTQGVIQGYLRTTNDCVVLPVAGMGTGAATFVGTWTGTITFYVGNTGDTADYSTMNVRPPNGSTDITSTSANGTWSGSVAGYRFFRVCMTSYSSGTAGVLLSSAATGGGGGTGGSSGVVSQGSTTSGQSGILGQGAVLTSAPTYTNGQTSPFVLNTSGALLTYNTNNAAGGTSAAENSSFTDNTTPLTPIGGVAESASPTACAEGKECTARMTLNRGVNMALVDSSGNYLTPSADYTEDVAVVDASTGPAVLTRRLDAPTASSAGTTNDWALLNTNAYGALWISHVDPCSSEVKITDPFSLTARGVVIAAVSAKKNYVCGITVVAGAAEIFNIDEGTGTTCQTGTAAIVGSTTAANGLSFAANGGMVAMGSNSTVFAGKTANVDTCIVPSGSNRLAGSITYVQR